MLFVSTPTVALQDQLVGLGAVAHVGVPEWDVQSDVIAAVIGASPADVHLVAGLDFATADIGSIWTQRVLTFEANLRRSRRAPRRQQPVLSPPDVTWPQQAERLISRLRSVIGGSIVRIDHVGSTAVPGLVAKDLIDIQIVVHDIADAEDLALKSRRAGFVHAAGDWYGEDRRGTRFREEVVVDADPGRPVNVNFRSHSDPVWKEVLSFRDFLRADTTERDNYGEMKRELTTQVRNIDEYGERKMPYIRAALRRAQSQSL
jgi:dephospho-CoA kinase